MKIPARYLTRIEIALSHSIRRSNEMLEFLSERQSPSAEDSKNISFWNEEIGEETAIKKWLSDNRKELVE